MNNEQRITNPPLPLAGLRVLDLSRVLAGPLCAQTLGDLGADVIKVERPGLGDETRGWGPPFGPDGTAAYFGAANRNKWSIALDLDAAADQDTLGALIAGADVVIDNFRPGTLERRGHGVLQYLEAHPRLLWCTITGFGPDSTRPGYDFVVQAESGWMAITGAPDGAPMKVGVALADVIAGKDAATALLALLAQRDRPRAAADRHVQVSLAHSATAALINVAQNVLVSGQDAARWGNAHPNLCPYELFDTADRPIVIAVGSDPQWLACATALGLDALAADPALRRNAGRVEQRERVVQAVAARCRSAPAAQWLAALDAAGVPCGVVRPVSEALSHFGLQPLPGGSVRRGPPALDADGPAIRREGWSATRSDP